MKADQQGFTLLEVVVAVAIASVVMISALAMLQGLHKNSQRLHFHQQKTLDIVRCVQLMTEDFNNIVINKQADGHVLLFSQPVDGHNVQQVNFTIAGQSRVAKGAELVAVQWKRQQGILYRRTSQSAEWQALPCRVKRWQLRFYQQGQWQWQTGMQPLPAEAIDIRLQSSIDDRYQRLILLGGQA